MAGLCARVAVLCCCLFRGFVRLGLLSLVASLIGIALALTNQQGNSRPEPGFDVFAWRYWLVLHTNKPSSQRQLSCFAVAGLCAHVAVLCCCPFCGFVRLGLLSLVASLIGTALTHTNQQGN